SALQHPQLAMRMCVAQVLGEMKIEQAVPQLITLLKDDPESIGRNYAAMALGEIADRRAVEPLIEALHNTSDQEARRTILNALGKLRDPRAVASLIEVVQDGNPYTACFAVEALGEIGDSHAFEPILQVLEHWNTDKKKWVRSWAASALGRLDDDRAFEPLMNALHDQDPKVRIGSAYGLGFLGDTRAIPSLRHAYRNDQGIDDDTGDTVKGVARKSMSRIMDRYNAMLYQRLGKHPSDF
ncbi:MAG TPA: HEAT repeat domain-containing protein, partial [Aggregatilineaceae bacterium]|nr:HEAT repeat domain-containing protein [Aggregatilineaceae bacterium]